MTRYKNVDGVRIELTAEEEAAKNASDQAWHDAAPARALAELRSQRNKLLAKTDCYALSDVTRSEAMTTYRQELRDLPSGLTTVEDAENVVYPTKP